MKHWVAPVATIAVAALVGSTTFVFSGSYNVGADAPHWPLTYRILQTFRSRSVDAHAKGIAPPNLEDPQLILKGAGQYASMCVKCHLAPGVKDSELAPGLYPHPPELAKADLDPRSTFWVIKHGLKMSAMPAWGLSHDDETIWSMVAFVRKLPKMSPQEYKDMVAKAPPDEEMEGMKNMQGMESMHDPAQDAKGDTPATHSPGSHRHAHME
ncbi:MULTISPECIES: cytochrome c [unclassified Caballeronia]|uniref:c-type cytochrome n=1 Tax=unclassified Caballeronia TaxID=2646786 RepID=UPI00285CA598|nr:MULTISPECIES: cytochrome c [unclassified Caballeronia]MDR5751302.1 cytochrome c [Caballeronia sp. LZ024]MDR5844560.1 cytochrome c [Caballeronia sp. LZ031]